MPASVPPGLDLRRLLRDAAIVMDGDGRWARQRGLHRIEGRQRGKDSVRAAVEGSRRLGIDYLSLCGRVIATPEREQLRAAR